MNGEIICVGTELLLGDILNTNAQYLAKELAALGISVYNQTTVGDNAGRLKKVLWQAASRSEIIIITGGLGPTKDDLTKETVAAAVGLELKEDSESLRRIAEYFARIGRPMTETNRKQALAPEGAVIFPNDNGTAPGYAIASGDQHIIMLPGPPSEMKPMFEQQVKPYLARLSGEVIVSHTVKIFGMGEAAAAEKVSDLLDLQNPTVAPYAKTGEVTLRVTAKAADKQKADSMCAEVVVQIRKRLGDFIYGIDAESLQEVVVGRLIEKQMKIATAESCTAGLLSKRITEIPGSSAVFDMGVTAYANAVKINALGVKFQTLSRFGAVSPEVAAEMAAGIKDVSGADIGVAITGVAGPEASEDKPVGLVYIALTDGASMWVRKIMAGHGGDREAVRIMASSTALDMARRYLEALPGRMEDGTPVGAPLAVLEGYSGITAAQVVPAIPEMPEIPAVPEAPAAPADPGVIAESYDDAMFRQIQNSLLSESGDEPAGETPEPLPQPDEGLGAMYLEKDTDYEKHDYAPVMPETDPQPPRRPWYVRLARYFFPWKGDSAGEAVRKSIFTLAVITVIVSGIYVAGYFLNNLNEKNKIDSVRDLWAQNKDNPEVGPDGIYLRFLPLLAQNSDTIGWMTISNTPVDNPVYKTTDNDFYVTHNMYKEKNAVGALFVDSRSTVTRDQTSQNLVIYGHHRKDGSMFGSLKKFRSLDFYKQNPTIQFDTLYQKGTYKIFSVFITNTLAEHDNNFIFNYRPPNFESQDAFLDWIDQIRVRSLFDTPVDVVENDQIITLSTCIYDFPEARLVIVARKVRDGESTTVNISEAKVNPTPLYPQIWYDKKGGSKPKITTTKRTTNSFGSGTVSSKPSSGGSTSAPAGGTSSSPGRPDTTVTSRPPSTSSPGGRPDPVTSAPPATSAPPEPSTSEDTVTSEEPATSVEPASSEEPPPSSEEPTPSEPPESPDGPEQPAA